MLFFFLKNNFRFTAKLSGKYRDSPYPSSPTYSLPHHQPPASEWYICHHQPTLAYPITPSPCFTLLFTLGYIHFLRVVIFYTSKCPRGKHIHMIWGKASNANLFSNECVLWKSVLKIGYTYKRKKLSHGGRKERERKERTIHSPRQLPPPVSEVFEGES